MLLNELQSLDEADYLDKDEDIIIHDNKGDYNAFPSASQMGITETIFIIKPFANYENSKSVLVIYEVAYIDDNGQTQINVNQMIGRYFNDGDNYCIVNSRVFSYQWGEPSVILKDGSINHRIIGTVKDLLMKWDNS